MECDIVIGTYTRGIDPLLVKGHNRYSAILINAHLSYLPGSAYLLPFIICTLHIR